MMPRCGEPFPERPASTCTRKPGHDPAIGHQVYCRDRLYVWHATPPPLFLPSPSLNRDGAHETRSTQPATQGDQS